jgi:hypothetical protein
MLSIGTTRHYALQEGATPKFVMTQAEFDAAFTQTGTDTTYSYRDMGKEVNIVGANSMRIATFRLVQRVSGTDTEGVGGIPPHFDSYYVCTWSANLAVNPVGVVRMG